MDADYVGVSYYSWGFNGSVTILGDLTIHANNFATLNKKNFTSGVSYYSWGFNNSCK